MQPGEVTRPGRALVRVEREQRTRLGQDQREGTPGPPRDVGDRQLVARDHAVDVGAALLGEPPLELLLVRGAQKPVERHAEVAAAPELRRDRPISWRARRRRDQRSEGTRPVRVQRGEADHRRAAGCGFAQYGERGSGWIVALGSEPLDDRGLEGEVTTSRTISSLLAVRRVANVPGAPALAKSCWMRSIAGSVGT